MSIYTGNVPYNPPRNILINGNFRLWSAGTSFSSFTNNVETPTADNWSLIQNPDGGVAPVLSVTRQSFALGSRPPFSPPFDPKFYLQIINSTTGSNLGTNSFVALRQHAPDVRSLTDQEPCIVEFWLKSAVTQMNIVLEIEQQFGTGGSPSATTIIGQYAFPIYGTGWQRYEASFTPPVLFGKTEGTNLDSNITINIYLQAGSGTGIIAQPPLFLPPTNTIGIFGLRAYPLNVPTIEYQNSPLYPVPPASPVAGLAPLLYTSKAQIQALTTVGVTPLPQIVFAVIGGQFAAFELNTVGSGDFQPNDYNVSTNNVSYTQVQ